jgi:hypothetical protein
MTASGLAAVVTEGGFSDPGSDRFTRIPSWFAFVIPRPAKVKLPVCEAPFPASPNTPPSNRPPGRKGSPTYVVPVV